MALSDWIYDPVEGEGGSWFNNKTGLRSNIQPLFDFGDGTFQAPGTESRQGGYVDLSGQAQRYGLEDGGDSRMVWNSTTGQYEQGVVDPNNPSWMTAKSTAPDAANFNFSPEQKDSWIADLLPYLGIAAVGGAGIAGLGGGAGGLSGGALSDSIIAEMTGGGLGSGTGVTVGGGNSVLTTLASKLGPTVATSLVNMFGEANLAKILPGIISAVGRDSVEDKLSEIAEKQRAERAPFLNKSLEWLNNPTAYAEGPGMASMEGVLAGLSSKFGNPIGSGAALSLATQAGLRDWRDAYTGAANIGLAGSDSRARIEQDAIEAGNYWPDLGDAAASAFGTKPDNSLAALLKKFGVSID